MEPRAVCVAWYAFACLCAAWYALAGLCAAWYALACLCAAWFALCFLSGAYLVSTGCFCSSWAQLEAQRRASEVALRRAVITAAELDSLPPEAATYRNLGKAYVLSPKETVMAWLEDVAGRADKDIKSAAGRKEALEGQLSRTEKEMKEVLGIKA